MFWMDKGLGVIEIGNTVTDTVNLIGDFCLTNATEIAQVFCLENKIQIVKQVVQM
jgi:hypothetical protein